jgi:hypothetical protein
MTLLQIRCFICGVGFTISRKRTRDEPRSHAWSSDEGHQHHSYSCSPKLGCTFVDREQDSDDFVPVYAAYDDYDIRERGGLEHVPGPDCNDDFGYNGHNVSSEDIGCIRVAQCILRKDNCTEDWQDAPDDEPWESASEWFLTGLNNRIVEIEIGSDYDRSFPDRHSSGRWFTAPYGEETSDAGSPFHPRCMEVYHRAAFAKIGKVDVDGFGQLSQRNFGGFTNCGWDDRAARSVDMARCAQQYWEHVKGTEFLIVNPLNDEKLMEFLQAAMDLSDSFDPNDSAFPGGRPIAMTAASADNKAGVDPFLKLPAELCQQILTHLPTKSIAALRVASRAFTHIPTFFFHRLVREDFPWIWEADPATSTDRPTYSMWTKKVSEIAARGPESWQELDAAYVWDAHERGMHKAHTAHASRLAMTNSSTTNSEPIEDEDDDRFRPLVLPRNQTNWFKLYLALKQHDRAILAFQKNCAATERPPSGYSDDEDDEDDGADGQHEAHDVISQADEAIARKREAALKAHGPYVPGLRNRERIWKDCEVILKLIDEMRAHDRAAEGLA